MGSPPVSGPNFPLPPSPKGSAREQVRDPLSYFLTLVSQHGDVVCYRSAPEPAYLVNHPDAIRHILVDNARNYSKETFINQKFRAAVGDGLLTSEGAAWRRQRQLLQPAFNYRQLAYLDAIVTGKTARLLERWRGFAQRGEALDLSSEMSSLTLSITTQALFGVDLGREMDQVGQAVDMAGDLLEKPNSTRFKTALESIQTIVERIIQERQQLTNGKQDLLATMLQARDPETGRGLDPLELRGQVETLLLAGYETTANALTWTWYLLAQHPECMQRLQAELSQALGGRIPTFQDLERLQYTRMVFEEALRIYPPAWVLGRRALADDVVGGFRTPAGTIIAISPYTVHRHPDFWDRPHDFCPERFADRRAVPRHRFAYLPFGAGQRKCIGNNMALIEAQLIIAMLAREFSFSLVSAQPVKPQPIFILRPASPVLCRLIPIE